MFLVATLPLVLSVAAQMAIGLGKIEVVSLSPLVGSLVNLPLSYYLTTRLGVSGVIWGTVLTTLVSNLLVPGAYLVHVLEIRAMPLLVRTLSAPMAGSALLIPAAWICATLVPPQPTGPNSLTRAMPLFVNLTVASLAYLIGYTAISAGHADWIALTGQIRARVRRG